MKNESSSAQGDVSFTPVDGKEITSLYSMFSPSPSRSTSPLGSPSSNRSTESNTVSNSSTPDDNKRALNFTFAPAVPFIAEHQELVNRHHKCLNHLLEVTKEAAALRQENATLRLANRDLNKRLSNLIQAAIEKHAVSSSYTTLPVVNRFQCLSIGEKSSNGCVWDEGRSIGEKSSNGCVWDEGLSIGEKSSMGCGVWDEGFTQSPTSVIQNDLAEKDNVERDTLPKSISVRSNYLVKASQEGGNYGARNRARFRSSSPLNANTKVFMRAGGAMEFEVYNQGMVKTELCNKWQQTGTCPYGDHCQFAHGVEELRPVIRHPRYKTEVCRMIVAGDPCPYGHRCHFRHALTDQEKLMVSLNRRLER